MNSLDINALRFTEIKENKIYKKAVKQLYKQAFPLNERAPFFLINRLAHTDRAKCFAISEKDTFVGMAYSVIDKDIVYVFYLAIAEHLRGRGYGSRILAAIRQRYGEKRIILMAEESTDAYKDVEARLKRKQFYYANGLVELNYKVNEFGVVYDMLGFADNSSVVSGQEYMSLMQHYWGDAMYRLVYVRMSKLVE